MQLLKKNLLSPISDKSLANAAHVLSLSDYLKKYEHRR